MGALGQEGDAEPGNLCREGFAAFQAEQDRPGRSRVDVLKPYYDNWKAGQAAPVNGTPLAAWPGATPQLVKALTPGQHPLGRGLGRDGGQRHLAPCHSRLA
jgi:hypothetical protein